MKIRNELVNDVVARTIEWPDNKPLYGFINALMETNQELAFALEEIVNAHVAATAHAAFVAGFVAGQNPVKLLFTEGNAEHPFSEV